ncbi:protein translocase SEC61 complex subunit gamma [Candidatus Woesearchaeota archaeon]|nr:protein translocase SEC61 complex subunit gamma [Candidatus Woesearchaeota archaeon]
MLEKLKLWFIEARRVLAITKKPNRQEFMTIVKVTSIGTLIIGLIGFIISISYALITLR